MFTSQRESFTTLWMGIGVGRPRENFVQGNSPESPSMKGRESLMKISQKGSWLVDGTMVAGALRSSWPMKGRRRERNSRYFTWSESLSFSLVRTSSLKWPRENEGKIPTNSDEM